MLRAMGLVAQWRAIASGLPDAWTDARLRVVPLRPADTGRVAALLGPLAPGHSGDELYVQVFSSGASGPAVFERLLARVDAEGIPAALELAAEAEAGPVETATDVTAIPLADQWDRLVAALPKDWSDLLCLLELRSSDELDPAALAIAPLNPSRQEGVIGFRFRVARRFGYGAAPEMARRCLARLDEAEIPGTLSLLEAFSDTKPVLTQGPTFVVGGRAV
jgi:hypothetical protein